MSERPALLFATALDQAEAEERLEQLRKLDVPNITKLLAVVGKFDGQGVAKTLNMEANYPAELPQLLTNRHWTEAAENDARYRDGYDLYALARILSQGASYGRVILCRGKGAFSTIGGDWKSTLNGEFFAVLGTGAGDEPADQCLLFNVGDDRFSQFLDAAWGLYACGVVYGIESYSFEAALAVAANAVRLESELLKKSEDDGA